MTKALRFLQSLVLICHLFIPVSLSAETGNLEPIGESRIFPKDATDDEETFGQGSEEEMTEEEKKIAEEQKAKKEEIEQMHQTLQTIRSVQNTTQTLRAAKVKVPKRS